MTFTLLVTLAALPSQAVTEIACAMTQATIARDEAGIRETMAAYNAALNGGKTAAVLPLYTEDGVFMTPYSQSAVGKSAVATAYDKVFDELQFDVKFTIAELVVMAPNWAYVRTNSAGTTFHRSLGKKLAEANQELFIFKKGDDGKWRIARYSFSPTNPPAQ
ncbi:MAG: SgcJ/EcaC family oxidoreductase [Acetobacteraceae bacterium]|nr:SgcJ/EcaC family oxidoreductase [Acetobacteraceae bacterium]